MQISLSVKIILACILIQLPFLLKAQDKQQVLLTNNYSNKPILEVLQDIEEQTDVKFYYKTAWVLNTNVTAQYQNIKLTEVLPLIFRNTKLSFIIYNPYAIIIVPDDLQQSEQVKPVLDSLAKQISNRKIVVKGLVKDGRTGEPIAGASVTALESKAAAITNEKGLFNLTLTAKNTTLSVTYLGYEKAVRQVALTENSNVTVEMFKSSAQLSEVKILGKQPADNNVSGVQTGITRMEIAALKKLPTFLGEVDVIKNIKMLPGVTSVGEAATGFNVRGGNIDQNLILLDDAPLYNSSHVFGFFSVFNPEAIKDATLYRGGIPAQYGGRISSVLEVKQKFGNAKRISGSGGVGPITGRLAIEGPLGSDKTTFIVAGRSSYSNWLLRKMPNDNLKQSRAGFYDVSVKVGHAFNEKNQLAFSAYQSSDNFGFAKDTLYAWANRTATLKYSRFFSSNFIMDIAAVYSKYQFSLDFNDPVNDLIYSNGISNNILKTDFLYTLQKHEFQFGASFTNYNFQTGNLKPERSGAVVEPVQVEPEQSLESALYLNHKYDITPRLTVMSGLRFAFFHNYGLSDVFLYEEGVPKRERTIIDTLRFGRYENIKSYNGIEPRLSVKYSLNAESSVKIGYNRLNQFIHLISNTAAASPVDIWKTSNTYIKPQVGDQISLGYFRNFKNNAYETSVEGYYKKINNILDYKNGATLFLNKTLEADLLPGLGKAYGIETIINKKNGKLTGMMSYTYSRTLIQVNGATESETINRGEYYAANYDKPHIVNLVSSYQVKRRVSLSANFTYSTGRPITVPQSYFEIDNVRVPNYGDRNMYRIPDYHRLDLSLSILSNHKKNKKWEGSWNISVYNAYGRKNPYSVFFKHFAGTPPRAYQLAVVGVPLPAITYDFKF